MRLAVCRTEVRAGDMLLAYTDGVTDATGPEGVFGEGRLLEVIGRSEGRWAGLLDQVMEALALHTADAERHDDVTLLAVSRLSAPSGSQEGGRHACD